jgi:beta-lactamase regulating signal transducer with metallopeptidase domain
MTSLIKTLNGLAGAWAGMAWAVTWQSTLLVGVFALVAWGMRRSSPSVRYWIWQIAAIKLLVMPLWGVSILLPATPDRDISTSSDSRPTARYGGEIGSRPDDWRRALDHDATPNGLPRKPQERQSWSDRTDWRAWLLLGWALVVAGQVIAIAHQRQLLERLLRQAACPGDPALLRLSAELSSRIGLRRQPEVKTTDGDGSPFVCGLRHPILVLPRGLADSIGHEALRSVLLHELAHLKRRDLLWDWIPTVARVLYFFHPAAHYIVYRARLERELACDQAAMALTGQGAACYASTLVEVVSRSSSPPALRAALVSVRLDGAEPFPAPGAVLEITHS